MVPISETSITHTTRSLREVKEYERQYLCGLVRSPNTIIASSAQEAILEIEQKGGTSLSPDALLYMGNEHSGI